MVKVKTNALRVLDKSSIPYQLQTYSVDESDLSGMKVVEKLNVDFKKVYKTLVLQSNDKQYLVCCLPVNCEVDLKKLAKLSKHKKVEMIAMRDLQAITGYIRGGCSPVAMKKQFPTYFQEDILLLDEVYLSAGKRGVQMIVKPQDIISLVNGEVGDFI